MLTSMALVLLLAESPASQPTMPRQAEPPKQQSQAQSRSDGETSDGLPADPLFDKPRIATDDPAFVLAAIESGRQGVMDARAGASGLPTPELRAAAMQIGEQQEATLKKLESIAKTKGWRLPEGNPSRTGTVPVSGPVRTSADFIINQIAQHQSTVAQFRAQAAGKGDPQLRRALREALPGYQKNLDMLLQLKP
jgi:hypothetical protein